MPRRRTACEGYNDRMQRAVVAAAMALALAVPIQTQMASKGLTDVPGIKVGHVTRAERPTGCTVILAEAGAVAGVDVRGSAPGTIETDLLNPVNLVQHVHAVFLSGGSAFGLDVATGVRKYLYERQIGFETRVAKVPIVPGAIMFDLGVGGKPDIWPTADCGYRAAVAANDGPVAEGNVGAGAGATVGKSGGGGSMKGGLGTASVIMPDGLVVAAIVAVNAVGDVIDPNSGAVVAGVRTPDGKGLADARKLLLTGSLPRTGGGAEHDDRSRRHQRAPDEGSGNQDRANGARRARPRALSRAHDGRRRRDFRARDGKPGQQRRSRIGALGAEVMAQAIVRGVRAAESIPGYPAARDIK